MHSGLLLSRASDDLGLSRNTVERYLNLLEKALVIRKLTGFSRNLRTEITRNCRYCFLDNGIRNALINNFNPLELRDDLGMLWENYLVVERMKKQEYIGPSANNFFWRTYSKNEVDFVEEREGRLFGYEMKWGKARLRPPGEWRTAYPAASWDVMTRDNSFITGTPEPGRSWNSPGSGTEIKT